MEYESMKHEKNRLNILKYAEQVWLTLSDREQQAIYDVFGW